MLSSLFILLTKFNKYLGIHSSVLHCVHCFEDATNAQSAGCQRRIESIFVRQRDLPGVPILLDHIQCGYRGTRIDRIKRIVAVVFALYGVDHLLFFFRFGKNTRFK